MEWQIWSEALGILLAGRYATVCHQNDRIRIIRYDE